jgi:hypothetical protein
MIDEQVLRRRLVSLDGIESYQGKKIWPVEVMDHHRRSQRDLMKWVLGREWRPTGTTPF